MVTKFGLAELLLAGGVLAAGWLGPVCTRAIAGEPPRPSGTGESAPIALEEVTVTATKTPRDPVETPGEVNVISREEIDRTQAQSLEDVLKYQPGVDMTAGPRRIGETPVIRGLGGPRVLVTVDGARLDFESGHHGKIFLDMDMVKRIEIVRGPASALWGSGALGGVVAFTTKDPSDFLLPGTTFGLLGKVGFQGASDELLFSPTLFGRIGPDLEYLLSYTGRRSDDIRLGGDVGTLPNSAEDLDSGLGKLVWRLTPHDQLGLSVLRFGEEGRVPANPASTDTAPASLVDRETEQVTYRLGYRHENPDNPYLNLDTFAYFTTMDITEFRVTDGRRDDIELDTVGFDLRNTTRLGDPRKQRHVLTYGVEGYRDSQDAVRAGGPNTLFPNADATTVALYIQDEVTLWDRWILIPGVRWDRWENESPNQRNRADSELSPKLGSLLKITDSLFLEANYAEGFRAPTFGELFIAGTHFPGAVFVPNPDLDPEKSRNVEAGVRIKRDRLLFEHDRLLVRGAYFRNKVEDFIDFQVTFVPPAGPLEFKAVNVQDAIIRGYEAELMWEFPPGFTLSANYTDTRGTNETDDVPLATIPPRKGVVGLSYRHAPWALTVGGRAQIVDAQDRVPPGVQRTGGYTVYDIFAGWEPGGALAGLRVDLGVDNVTDHLYRRHLAGIPEAGINPKATVSYIVRW